MKGISTNRQYFIVKAGEFELALCKLKDKSSLATTRMYVSKVCYMDADCLSGFCLTEGGTLCHVFSLEKGRGKDAVLAARDLGANRLSCFGNKLHAYYEQLGFKVSVREVDKKTGKPDKTWMVLRNQKVKGALT